VAETIHNLYTRLIKALRPVNISPQPLWFSYEPYFVGIECRGTNIKFGLVDDEGQTSPITRCAPSRPGARRCVCAHGLAAEQLVQKAAVERRTLSRGLATPGADGINKE